MIPTDITMNNLYLVYLFNQDGLIEIQYLFYQGVLVKIDKKDITTQLKQTMQILVSY